jgi:pyruvate formate lyase activating enzyme
MREALFYEGQTPGVRCLLCPHYCRLQKGEAGVCGVRREHGGKLYSENYGLCAAKALDPVEKKPLYHFYPGRKILSLGTLGCNLQCGFCQNWHLSRSSPAVETVRVTPSEVVVMLEQLYDCPPVGVAYTYSEPGVWYEFVLDTARAVRESGRRNVLVTNGFLNREPLLRLLPLIDAFNIDVKSFRDDFYRKFCGGRLQDVRNYVEIAAASAHVELTYLVIATLNDNEQEIRDFVQWVANLNPAIPVHLSRYFPQAGFTLPPTPLAVLKRLWEVARETLPYVYLGNVPDTPAANTRCPGCGKKLVLREGYRVTTMLQNGSCPYCGRPTDIITDSSGSR